MMSKQKTAMDSKVRKAKYSINSKGGKKDEQA